MKITENQLRRFVFAEMDVASWFSVAEQLGQDLDAARRVDELIAEIEVEIERVRLVELHYVMYGALRDFWHVFGAEEKLKWQPAGWSPATTEHSVREDESGKDC